jgi:hypothetical protein
MATLTHEADRFCLNCNKILRGRIDKKFCDDACRNNYNNRQNSDSVNEIRNINNILKKNRRLLESLLLKADENKAKIAKLKLIEMGYNIKYHTHTFTSNTGKQYVFCYEYGYMLMDNDWFFIVKQNAK